jgi:hypothetical protein
VPSLPMIGSCLWKEGTAARAAPGRRRAIPDHPLLCQISVAMSRF